MEATRARASPRPHRAQPRPRDTKAGPNPPDVWHSRGLPCLESPRQRATAESRGRSAPSPFRTGSESFKGRESAKSRSPFPKLCLRPSAPLLPRAQGRCPSTAPACQPRTAQARRPGHDGKCSPAAPRARQPRASEAGARTTSPAAPQGRRLPAGQPASPPAPGAGTPLTCRGRRRCCPGAAAAATPAAAVGSVPLLVLRHRGPPGAAYTWELSEDQPMELHCLLVRLCGGRLRGESRANKRGEERRG